MQAADPEFDDLLRSRGFDIEYESGFIVRYSRSGSDKIARHIACWGFAGAHSVMLGHGDVPKVWPARGLVDRVSETPNWTTAQSPLMVMDHKLLCRGERDDVKVRFFVDWLNRVGFCWLDCPILLSPSEWAELRLYVCQPDRGEDPARIPTISLDRPVPPDLLVIPEHPKVIQHKKRMNRSG